MNIDYKSAGVDVERGDQLVDWLKKTSPANSPHHDKLVSGIGGFAAIFRMQFPEMKKPCLVSSTDGIGTKIKLAVHFEKYDTVGQDLVAMCVNDLVCCGAEPLFFLDYYASGKLDLAAAKEFLGGVRAACITSGCALIGGETAEMPGVYHERDFDAAGFAVGIVDEEKILGPHRVSIGNRVIGIASSGFHSNGFSLLRKIFEQDLDKWRDLLLTPTNLYAGLVLKLVREGRLNAVANITGGGMENIPRVLPRGTVLPLVDWAWPEAFGLVQDRSGMARVEMLKTLNCGVGLALVVAPEQVVNVEAEAVKQGYRTYNLGTIDAAKDPAREAEVLY